MQIIVEIEAETVFRYYKRGSALFFPITLEHEGMYYPDKQWSDFGVVILGWWFSTIQQLLDGGTEGKFVFMDGPYAIKLIYDRATDLVELTPEGLDTKWCVTFAQCINELIHAADKICQKLIQLKVDEKEWLSLKLGVARLKSDLKAS